MLTIPGRRLPLGLQLLKPIASVSFRSAGFPGILWACCLPSGPGCWKKTASSALSSDQNHSPVQRSDWMKDFGGMRSWLPLLKFACFQAFILFWQHPEGDDDELYRFYLMHPHCELDACVLLLWRQSYLCNLGRLPGCSYVLCIRTVGAFIFAVSLDYVRTAKWSRASPSTL